jgi:GAF domain-containing protein
MAASVDERLAQTFVELADTRVAELFQIQHDESPCVDCFRSGQPVIIGDISIGDVAARWPRFGPAALQMGFAGVHAIPMRLRDQVIGTMNLFRSAPDALDQPVARAAGALVDVATIGILQERAVRQQELVAAQLQAALHSRVMIEQAKGVLAERHQVTPDQAFLILRRHARNHNRPLTALAGDVIGGTVDIDPGGQATTRPAPHGEPGKPPGPQATSGPGS